VNKDLLQALIEELQKILANKKFRFKIEVTGNEKTDL